MLTDEERVLHVAGRMVGGKVHLREDMQVVFHLGPVGQDEAHAREDVDDFVGDDGERMARAQLHGVRRAGQVDVLVGRILSGAVLAQLVDALGSQRLQFVDFHAHRLFLVGSHVTEVVHEGRDFTFLAEVFQTELFHFVGILSAQRLYFFEKFVYLVEYHGYLLFDDLRFTI